jgi:lipoprotein NlpI
MYVSALRWFTALVCSLATAITVARADSFSDHFAGARALQQGDIEAAIHLYTRALATGDLSSERAVAARIDLATAYAWKGDYERSIADFDRVIELDPKNPFAYEGRSHANFLAEQFRNAADDFAQALQLGNESYRNSLFVEPSGEALWLHLSRKKAGQDDAREFARNTAELVPKGWPHIYAAFFRGLITAEELAQAELGTLDGIKHIHACSTPFFLGEHALHAGDKRTARDFFRKASGACARWRREYYAAQVELRRIDD